MNGKLSTHVLDTASGQPAAGVEIELWRLEPEEELLTATRSNADGRTDGPLLHGAQLRAGRYRLVFAVAEYFASQGHPDAGRFLEHVPVEFRIEDPEAGYHVPLLVSPWAYSTYRGS